LAQTFQDFFGQGGVLVFRVLGDERFEELFGSGRFRGTEAQDTQLVISIGILGILGEQLFENGPGLRAST
jgi:hypothetical protein